MHLTKVQEYGLRSMILLASRSKPDAPQLFVQAKEISQIEDISPKFLEHILLLLTKAGLLHSKIGAGGGYRISRPANQISFGQIIRALDGRLEPVKCMSNPAGEVCSCPREATCGVRMVMTDVYESIASILDHTSLEDVSNRLERAQERLKKTQVDQNAAMLLS